MPPTLALHTHFAGCWPCALAPNPSAPLFCLQWPGLPEAGDGVSSPVLTSSGPGHSLGTRAKSSSGGRSWAGQGGVRPHLPALGAARILLAAPPHRQGWFPSALQACLPPPPRVAPWPAPRGVLVQELKTLQWPAPRVHAHTRRGRGPVPPGEEEPGPTGLLLVIGSL